MGIFDIVELQNDCRAIKEILVYMDTHPDDKMNFLPYAHDHLNKMMKLLVKLQNE